MSEFFEYDPLTGLRTELSWSEAEQKMTVTRSQDCSAILDYAKAFRNENGLNRNGIKESWWCYATIPPGVQLEMRRKGIIVGNKDHAERVIAEINTNYPHLKLTTGNMGGKAKLHVG
jgi:hypothetical protein